MFGRKIRISIIAAIGERNRVLGRDNDLPWSKRLRPDMRRFTDLTTGHPVVMGRKTWDSIPEKFRPLPDRTNLVLTSQQGAQLPGAHIAHSMSGALQHAEHFPGSEEIFIIGGSRVYENGMRFATRLYLTLVDEDADGDTFFPEIPGGFREVERTVEAGFEPRLTYVTLDRG